MAQGQQPYQPEGNTPIAVLYEHAGYTNAAAIAYDIGVSPNTIRKWDRDEVWPHWALEKAGFEVVYVGFDEDEEVEDEIQ